MGLLLETALEEVQHAADEGKVVSGCCTGRREPDVEGGGLECGENSGVEISKEKILQQLSGALSSVVQRLSFRSCQVHTRTIR